MDYEPVAARPVGVMLVGPDREGSFRVPLLRPAMAMPEGLGRHAAPATKGLVEVRQIIEASLRGDLGERHRRTAHETLGPLEFDLLEVGFQRHANHLVEDVRELGGAQRGHGRKIGTRKALPDVPVEKRADSPHGTSVPGHGERIAQEGRSRSHTLADRLAGERWREPTTKSSPLAPPRWCKVDPLAAPPRPVPPRRCGQVEGT